MTFKRKSTFSENFTQLHRLKCCHLQASLKTSVADSLSLPVGIIFRENALHDMGRNV
ncbi:hypothetical protein ATORI0001_1132 [Lancefieldella rimae ATCC 49626]|uniref:Uncharacterized protein n=2 Tax=Lancefieldella rimae TaxID=1383 RepID=B9CLF8_LANR4|nr:hypothetical protein ATORI0001_1132 [Lancefieldella rimae ATCC 49626]